MASHTKSELREAGRTLAAAVPGLRAPGRRGPRQRRARRQRGSQVFDGLADAA